MERSQRVRLFFLTFPIDVQSDLGSFKIHVGFQILNQVFDFRSSVIKLTYSWHYRKERQFVFKYTLLLFTYFEAQSFTTTTKMNKLNEITLIKKKQRDKKKEFNIEYKRVYDFFSVDMAPLHVLSEKIYREGKIEQSRKSQFYLAKDKDP